MDVRLTPPLVVLVTGVPGTGKSTIAEAVAGTTGWPIFNWDWLMSGLAVFPKAWEPIGRDRELRRSVGWSLMSRLIEQRLRLRQSVILDTAAQPRALAPWSSLAEQYGAELRVIECSCSDVDLHRSRIVGRRRDIPGWPELEWEWVLESCAQFRPMPGDKLELDAIEPIDENVARAFDYLALGRC